MVLVVSINNSCGFVPLHNHPNSMDIFKNIRVQSDNTFIAFLIKEALEEKAPFRESAQNTLSLNPIKKNSYGVIQKENEITTSSFFDTKVHKKTKATTSFVLDTQFYTKIKRKQRILEL